MDWSRADRSRVSVFRGFSVMKVLNLTQVTSAPTVISFSTYLRSLPVCRYP